MNKYVVTYLSMEGRIVRMTVEAENEESAIGNAFEEDSTFNSGDNIYKIISVD